MLDVLVSIALIVFSMLVFLYRNALKKAFNSRIGFNGKRFIFGLIIIAPFTLIFGVVNLYNIGKFLINYDLYAKQCIAEHKGGALEILSTEREMNAVYVKFQISGSTKTLWCENINGKINFF